MKSKISQIRKKGSTILLPVTGFGIADTAYTSVAAFKGSNLDTIAVVPHTGGKIYARPKEFENGYKMQTIIARKEGDSVTLALTHFVKAERDGEYFVIFSDEPKKGFAIRALRDEDFGLQKKDIIDLMAKAREMSDSEIEAEIQRQRNITEEVANAEEREFRAGIEQQQEITDLIATVNDLAATVDELTKRVADLERKLESLGA
jgi:hypothetical protein